VKHLCDTNVLSELVKPRPNQGVLRWAEQVKLIGLSVVVVEEIVFGLNWRPNPRIRSWFDDFLERHCQVLPVTGSIAVRCGELRGDLRAKGQVRTQADMLLAATAAEYGLTLVTRNTRHFEGCGVALLNPFA
jgi:predicted nucleic acid-binding protein